MARSNKRLTGRNNGNKVLSVETPNENTEPVVTEPYISPVISDGYTKVSLIPGQPGLFSPVRLRWRKLSADQISAIAARSVTEPGGGQCKHYAEELAKRPGGNLIDWDIQTADGGKLPVTAAAIKALDYDFYSCLIAVVCGEKPGWEEPASDASPEAQLKNLLRA